jgi:dihydrofolate reductase
MAKLIYSALTSLDGYVNDESGEFEWATPDEQVHAFVNEIERGIGTYLYGRRIYQVMAPWETMETDGAPAVTADFKQIWRSADKVVFSRTVTTVPTARTRIEREFDPAIVAHWKETASRDLSVGGPELAAVALRAGLVDECHLFLHPVIVGGGAAALPDHLSARLELVDEHRFDRGVVHLHYRLQ